MRKSIIITGGAGSLGKAFVRLLHKTHEVTVVDNNEWSVAEMRNEYPEVRFLLRDFLDIHFHETPADVLIHLAAYKHVDLGESDPVAFVENNVTKTASLFEKAAWHGVDVLFVSTDKAVEPISTYGFTKALGERLATHYGFAVARLGNILSSHGSVIPVWEKAISEGMPIKITDERMRRFVIEDREAVHEIWDQYCTGERLIIPEMGQEVRLLDIMSDVLERHGYSKASDYLPGVEVIGMRPGEKLSEKLRWENEVS